MRNLRDAWHYLTDGANWTGDEGIWHLLVQQLLLSFTALAVAMLIGLTVALWLGHLGRAGFLTVNITNVGRAVPTFALLAILVSLDHPGTAEFGPYGRAGLATLIALALFALPPIYTNAYVAVREVAAPVKESAIGMGMTGSQRFWRVELPLALPLIVSGIRLALVQVWATATIAALVAGPGLGNLITQGFYNNDYPKGIAAAFVVAVVAFLLEVASAFVERAVDPNRQGTATRARPTRPRAASGVGA
jgi:osmoprotectant transport system permease protein